MSILAHALPLPTFRIWKRHIPFPIRRSTIFDLAWHSKNKIWQFKIGFDIKAINYSFTLNCSNILVIKLIMIVVNLKNVFNWNIFKFSFLHSICHKFLLRSTKHKRWQVVNQVISCTNKKRDFISYWNSGFISDTIIIS